MSKKKIGTIFLVMVAAVTAVGIWYFQKNDGKDSNDRVYVEKVSVITGKATGAQNRYSGVVEPQKTVDINVDSERTVKEILVKVGDTVEEGTPLFTYDTEDVSLELEQAKLELENQDHEINNYRNQIAELDKERKEAQEGEKFEYTTQIQTLETNIRQAEYEKSSKKLEMEKLQKKIDNSQVFSTASGVIKSMNDGQSQDDSQSAFISILSTGTYRVKGVANEQNVGMIPKGAAVIVRSRVDEALTWNGTIEGLDTGETASSDDSSDDGTDSSMTTSSKYPFYVTMESIDGLMLGQHVLIELDDGQMEVREGIWLHSSYIVQEGADDMMPLEGDTEFLSESTEMNAGSPEEAQGDQAAAAYVWADNGNGRLEKREVELGEYDEMLDEYQILSGLTEDDLIAWPMEGLYEGVLTVTNMDEVDYSSGLYNQEMGTEDGMSGDEELFNDTEWMDEDEYLEEDPALDDEYLQDIDSLDNTDGADGLDVFSNGAAG